MSLNEAYGKEGNFNTFENDNLLSENEATKDILDKAGEKLSYDSKEGKDDSQFGDNVADKDVVDEFEKVKLSENEMAIDEMITGESGNLESDKQAVISKVEDKLEPLINHLSPEQINSLQTLIDKLDITPNTNPDEIQSELQNNVNEGEDGDLKSKIANILHGIGAGNISAWGGVPAAIIMGSQIGMPAGFAASWGATTLLIGLAKILGKKHSDDVNEAEEIKKKFEKEYGDDGESIYYATAKSQDRDPKTFKLKESKKGFSIESALEKMDSIIGEDVTDKVNDLLNSLTESEKDALLNTLKKKD
jgi:hypothetical protein